MNLLFQRRFPFRRQKKSSYLISVFYLKALDTMMRIACRAVAIMSTCRSRSEWFQLDPGEAGRNLPQSPTAGILDITNTQLARFVIFKA